MNKFIVLSLIFLFLLSACKRSETEFSFPQKPITVIVYTGPGGLIDITARKFVDIASKYTDVTFVVENKPGSGGIVALKKLLQLPADGYTIFACTKSNISKIVATGGDFYIDAIDWAAMMMADPECVITNRNSEIKSWEDIVADAKEKKGKQLWLGPANGGLDHVTSLKIWDKVGIKAKWIPFKSGGKARAALLGKQGVAYVGNPREVLGNDELQIAAVSSSKRLKQFPDVPIFSEFGIEDMENEYMWRGFVYKKGTPPQIKAWYDELFTKVANDPEWKEYWENGGIDVTYKDAEEFTQIIKKDQADFEYYLQKLGIISNQGENFFSKLNDPQTLQFILIAVILFLIFLGILFTRMSAIKDIGNIMIPIFFIILALLFLLLSFTFPNDEEVGPSVVPRLWIFILIPLNIILLIKAIRQEAKVETTQHLKIIFSFVLLLIAYLLSIYYIGYFISSFLFLAIGMILLGYRKYWIIIFIDFGWLIFSYLIFYKMLYVPLPLGIIIEALFL